MADDEPVSYSIKILPVGDRPTFKISRQGEHRVLEKQAKGALPPATIKWSAESSQSVSLTLGKVSQPFKTTIVPPQTLSLFHKNGRPFWSGALVASPQNLIVLYQNEENPTWEHPAGLSLGDNSEYFPYDALRIVNVTPEEIEIKVGNADSTVLESGGHTIVDSEDTELSVTIYAKSSKGSLSRVLRTSLTKQQPNVRTTVVVHTAKPRRTSQPPVGISTYTETKK